jgi:hypothetical protein
MELSFSVMPEDWPKAEGGRLLCTSERPMPDKAPGLWVHPEAECVGGSHDGACDDYRCPACGVTWRNCYDDN